VTRSRLAALVLGVLLVAGCSAAVGESGHATLWVTRDRGAQVLLVRTVDAGQTAMQALEGAADIETRYGGRFVQSIDGVDGSVSARRDWFWFVNGIESDRSAAEYRLRAGDVEWWDYRSWARRQREPVVVGAFPEPFRHGYDGRVHPTLVRYPAPSYARAARAIARLLGTADVRVEQGEPREGANVFALRRGPRGRLVARPLGAGAGAPVLFELSGPPAAGLRLAHDPALVRRRYRWP
jgi:hypothetical protein